MQGWESMAEQIGGGEEGGGGGVSSRPPLPNDERAKRLGGPHHITTTPHTCTGMPCVHGHALPPHPPHLGRKVNKNKAPHTQHTGAPSPLTRTHIAPGHAQ